LFDFQKRELSINKLARLGEVAAERQSELSYIANHPDEFQSSPFDLPRIAAELQALAKFQSTVHTKADDCFSENGLCSVEDLAVPNQVVRPARK
jgi:hypothetical protein